MKSFSNPLKSSMRGDADAIERPCRSTLSIREAHAAVRSVVELVETVDLRRSVAGRIVIDSGERHRPRAGRSSSAAIIVASSASVVRLRERSPRTVAGHRQPRSAAVTVCVCRTIGLRVPAVPAKRHPVSAGRPQKLEKHPVRQRRTDRPGCSGRRSNASVPRRSSVHDDPSRIETPSIEKTSCASSTTTTSNGSPRSIDEVSASAIGDRRLPCGARVRRYCARTGLWHVRSTDRPAEGFPSCDLRAPAASCLFRLHRETGGGHVSTQSSRRTAPPSELSSSRRDRRARGCRATEPDRIVPRIALRSAIQRFRPTCRRRVALLPSARSRRSGEESSRAARSRRRPRQLARAIDGVAWSSESGSITQ